MIKSIKEICDTEKVSGIVLGESLAQGGQPNPIQEKIAKFKKILEQKINLPIYYIPEIWSSVEAGRYQEKRHDDSSAAAIILQRFLEKNTDA